MVKSASCLGPESDLPAISCWIRLSFSCALFFNSFRALPTSLRASGATFLNSPNKAGIIPFLLRYFILKLSSSSFESVLKLLPDFNISLILFLIGTPS
jgi:hypothetical protein